MSRDNRELDKTYLSLDLALERGIHHRDYGAHFFRWSHVLKHLQASKRYASAIVLDVGCGKEMPLAKRLYTNKMTPQLYVGVDLNKFEIPEMLRGKKIQVVAWSETDVRALDREDVSLNIGDWRSDICMQQGDFQGHDDNFCYRPPNVVVSFEALEHMSPAICRAALIKMRDLASDDAEFFFSTPCWNGTAAENHINEMTFAALGALLEDLGYHVQGVWGTFASIRDYLDDLKRWTYYIAYDGDESKPLANSMDLTPVFDVLREYYDTNVLATIFAPLFPGKSRNCLWHLTKTSDGSKRRFSPLAQTPGPWSQHPRWMDLNG